MQRFLAAGLVALTASSAFAADTYTIDSRHTFPSFEISHLGFSTQRGRFNDTKGKLTLDTAAKSGSVEISISTGSIDTGLDKLEEHLRGPDFFDAQMHPTITFKSSKFTFDGANLTKVDGELTMKGVTHPISMAATNFRCAIHPMLKKQVCGADLSGTVKRSTYGINYAIPAVGDDVKLFIQVEAINDKAS
jgi:polyisoprenoid-binding protein YceI